MELLENSELNEENDVENTYEQYNRHQSFRKTIIEKAGKSRMNDQSEDHVRESVANKKRDRVVKEYISGNWETFFNIWNSSFPLDVRESIEYKVLTLKLRVHFAILPIRIVQLHQNTIYAPETSETVHQILGNVVDKFSFLDDEKDSEDERSKVSVKNMKQLEDFLNSFDGQNLTAELKDNSIITFFALPYIVNPQEDESVRKIFSIDWLEELTIDLKKFIERFLKEERPLPEEKSEISDPKSSYADLGEFEKCSTTKTPPLIDSYAKIDKHETNYTEIKTELLSKDKVIKSSVKNREIEDWITISQSLSPEDHNLCTKGTQTNISSTRKGIGFSLVSESNYNATVAIHNTVTISSQQIVMDDDDELAATKSRLSSLQKRYGKLKMNFHNLHEDYQKMNEIAEELTLALENSFRGQPVNLEAILQSCMKIFPKRDHRDVQTDSEDTSVDIELPTEERRNIADSIPVSAKLLDYEKIKLHLRCGDIKTKLLLLQALRQKLTLYQSAHTDETIFEYTQEDLLAIKDNDVDSDENSLLFYILQPIHENSPNNFIQQSASRLLNAIASLRRGRTYLTSDPIILDAIIKYLDSLDYGVGDAITLDMLLATLQKMSLRKNQRKYMVEANLVEWLIHYLRNENFKMGAYRLEYTCALLMNLSLQSAARMRASVVAPLLISTMVNLLSSDCTSVLPFVNGALQNFLLNDHINNEAKKLHLTEILEYYCSLHDREMRNNFTHTLRIHRRECDEYLSDEDEFPDEDDDIFDVLEKELEENDPVQFEVEELQGENLLAMCYISPNVVNQNLQPGYSTQDTRRESLTLINNLLSRESENVGLNGTTITTTSETVFDDSKTEIVEEKCIKRVANSSQRNTLPKEDGLKFSNIPEENVFSAKHRLMRTPPQTARTEINQERILKKAHSRAK